MTRGSTIMPMHEPAKATTIVSPTAVSGASHFQNIRIVFVPASMMRLMFLHPHVVVVNIKLSLYVDYVNIHSYYRNVPRTRERRPSAKKRRKPYHHGDLRRALVEQALRTIQARGVDALTLRAAGQSLGVSRTALYRHFTDKSALLSAVATEGFR